MGYDHRTGKYTGRDAVLYQIASDSWNKQDAYRRHAQIRDARFYPPVPFVDPVRAKLDEFYRSSHGSSGSSSSTTQRSSDGIGRSTFGGASREVSSSPANDQKWRNEVRRYERQRKDIESVRKAKADALWKMHPEDRALYRMIESEHRYVLGENDQWIITTKPHGWFLNGYNINNLIEQAVKTGDDRLLGVRFDSPEQATLNYGSLHFRIRTDRFEKAAPGQYGLSILFNYFD